MFKGTGLFFSVVSASLIGLYSPFAQADCTTDTDSQWECLEIETSAGSGVYSDQTPDTHTFEGTVSLYHPFLSIGSCTWTWSVYFIVGAPANAADVVVTDATSTGPGNCPNIVFGGLSWFSSVSGENHGDVNDKHGGTTAPPNHDHNAFGDLGTIEILWGGTLTICQGTLSDVEFGNDVNNTSNKNNPSFFTFSGTIEGCSVSGTLTTNGYTDVNAW